MSGELAEQTMKNLYKDYNHEKYLRDKHQHEMDLIMDLIKFCKNNKRKR